HAIFVSTKAIGMKTTAAVKLFIKDPVPHSAGSPDGRIGGAEEADHLGADGGGDMHRPVVIADHQGGALQYRCHFLQTGAARETPARSHHRRPDLPHNLPILIASQEQNLRLGLGLNAVRESRKTLFRPGFEPPSRPRMKTYKGSVSLDLDVLEKTLRGLPGISTDRD